MSDLPESKAIVASQEDIEKTKIQRAELLLRPFCMGYWKKLSDMQFEANMMRMKRMENTCADLKEETSQEAPQETR